MRYVLLIAMLLSFNAFGSTHGSIKWEGCGQLFDTPDEAIPCQAASIRAEYEEDLDLLEITNVSWSFSRLDDFHINRLYTVAVTYTRYGCPPRHAPCAPYPAINTFTDHLLAIAHKVDDLSNDEPPPEDDVCMSLQGDEWGTGDMEGYYEKPSFMCGANNCRVSIDFAAYFQRDGKWFSGFSGTYNGKQCWPSDRDLVSTEPPSDPPPEQGPGEGEGEGEGEGNGGQSPQCPPGKRPGQVNGETVCVDAGGGDDDGGGGPPKPGGGGHMVHNGPYACVSVSEPYIDGSDAPPASGIDCVFCGVPGMPPCSVAIREFDQLKQPLEQLAANGDASKALLEEIRDAIRNRGIGGGGGNGGNGGSGGNGGNGPGGNGPGGDGSGSGGDGDGDGDGDGNAEEQPEKEEECPPGSDRAACATLGDVDEGDGDGDEPPEHEITYKAENLFSGGASCPANVVSMVNGVSTVLFDWQLACRYITGYMRPILLVLAAMTALLIVVPRS